ncbi:COG1361 S-layer family protein [Candidatus Woesearchaeota archaeon]|nr:COG1361 S-layer family protein [Candidatus Woesearchaeota archaeon]
MKRISIIGLVILVIGIFQVLGYTENDIPYLYISETKYEPYPAEPGGYFDLWLNVQNKGRDATGLMFKLEPEFPFSLDPGETAERNFGKILSGQSVLVHYRVRVSPNAVEGSNKLKYLFKSKSYEDWNEASISIMIKTHDILLAITEIETNPKKIRPGKTGSIEIGLKNMADSLIKDLKARLILGGVPLAPIGATNEKMVQRVDSNEELTVKFTVMAEPDATADIYKLPLELEYADELGNNYNRNNTISVIIGDVPDLAVNLDSSTIYKAGTVGEIVVKFVNKGLTDVKFLNVKIKPGEGHEVISPEEVYVGNIDSDDYETAEFKLFVSKANGEAKIPLTIEYMDANNDEYTKLVELSLPLYGSREAKQFGFAKGGGFGGILITIIIVAVAVFGYKKWKKRKAKKQQ